MKRIKKGYAWIFVMLSGIACCAIGEVEKPSTAIDVTPTESGPDLFLGDSITHAGGYVAYVESFMRLRDPAARRDFINAGLPSETVSGLSEDGHAGGQFRRPVLSERLDRVLKAVRPKRVFACYGMNDGIYLPMDEDRFRAFREGITTMREKVLAAGAEMIHVTPPVYDQRFAGGGGTNYDAVLGRYAEWLLERRREGWRVIDVRSAMHRELAEQRQSDPGFYFSKDGVHPNDAGHRVMARAVLEGLGLEAPPEIVTTPVEKEVFQLVSERQQMWRDAWLTHTNHVRPGMKEGLPIPVATIKDMELEQRILWLLGGGGG